MKRPHVYIIVVALAVRASAPAQQITINRIEQMPNVPSPYCMRDWKAVARGYDSLVFDFSRSGTYLPLGEIVSATINYPQHPSFGLHSYVGTNFPNTREAINCLPAVVEASLVGIDKSNQHGRNWALMAEEWFNRRPTQNVYKNGWVDDSGEDFWYLTMPNVFFYQLNALYPHTGDFDYQFRMVADRWLQAVRAMGGRTTPWQIPNINHRGWFLQTMTPYDQGVRQPEAAGALAWLFYNAFVRTDSAKYRIGAEWAMEFLDNVGSNPSYELQLPYGAYLAARMNAELGTTYNVERMVNWCFDVGPLRSWGAIVGTWGGYDVSGLIGEVNGTNDYAFAMNTFEHIGALVPLVRYDDRFARAIGKWVLNAANAARLFYPALLPDSLQDNAGWARQYDSSSVIAYEALRQVRNGRSPYATGDAMSAGWAQTNLALYGSSHVGILGGIIDTTNVPMILRLDVLKTDYYHAPAYPTYLYFNPHGQTQVVNLDVGSGLYDLYDAVSNAFVRMSVTGVVSFPVAANSAALIVVAPAGGTVTYNLDQMLINGRVVDYRSGRVVANYPPRIKALAAERETVVRDSSTQLFCTAMDRDGDPLSFIWQTTGGTIFGSGSNVVWVAPDSLGTFVVRCIVDDGRGSRDTAYTTLTVVAFINHPPVVGRILARPRKITLNGTTEVTCSASDPDGDSLTYQWSAPAGWFSGSGARVVWHALALPMDVALTCRVSDGRGGVATDSVRVRVRDFSLTQSGNLVALYPFNGSAQDESGFGNHGIVRGATLTADRRGVPQRAYHFDGLTQFIEVPNSSSLNFQQSATISYWMLIDRFYEREQYPLSHGNWENRWKISISNRRARWTIKTTSGIKDLDSETELTTGVWYNITALYDGSDIEVYVNGELDAFATWSGQILQTPIALTIGQVLPTNQSYNFAGILDDIRIYNYALPYDTIRLLGTDITSVRSTKGAASFVFRLEPNYPNPFSVRGGSLPAGRYGSYDGVAGTTLRFSVPTAAHVRLSVYNVLGERVATLLDGPVEAGEHRLQWIPEAAASGTYFIRLETAHGSTTRPVLLLR
jgi:hypothetical protein